MVIDFVIVITIIIDIKITILFIIFIIVITFAYTVWHENFTVIKFYGLPLNCVNEKLTGF